NSSGADDAGEVGHDAGHGTRDAARGGLLLPRLDPERVLRLTVAVGAAAHRLADIAEPHHHGDVRCEALHAAQQPVDAARALARERFERSYLAGRNRLPWCGNLLPRVVVERRVEGFVEDAHLP